MSTVLVTGATGFVGSHVARALAARGSTVRALVRPTSSRKNLHGVRHVAVCGDLLDPDSLREAVSGCDCVYHVAADYRLWCQDPAAMYRANVDGTRAILLAARQAGVPRVIYTSTVGALGIPRGGGPGTEATPVALSDMVGHYKRSKFLAEREAERLARDERVPVVIVNPSTPVGEADIKPTPTGRIIVDFLNGRMPAFVDTGLNLVDVRDVALGHLLAAERGVPGERYILAGVDATLQEILAWLGEIAGLPAPRRRIPYALAYAAGVVDTFVEGTLLRREPRVPLEGVRMAAKRMFFDGSRARRELGFTPGPVRGALERAVAWFGANGYAPAGLGAPLDPERAERKVK